MSDNIQSYRDLLSPYQMFKIEYERLIQKALSTSDSEDGKYAFFDAITRVGDYEAEHPEFIMQYQNEIAEANK